MGDVDTRSKRFFAHLAVNVTLAFAIGLGAIVALAVISPLFGLIAAIGMTASATLPAIVAARTKRGGEHPAAGANSARLNADSGRRHRPACANCSCSAKRQRFAAC